MRRTVCLLALCAVGCGGKVEGDDSGTSPDSGATPGPDSSIVIVDATVSPDVIVTPSCTTPSDSVSISQNGCQAESTWSCGTTTFTVTCSCPDAQCTCSQESGGMGGGTVMAAPAGTCPGCGTPVALDELCGFPH